MSETKQFRTKSILVTPAVYDALKVLADIEGHDCPDSLADLRLGLMLSNEADIQWLVSERKKRMDALRADYRKRITAKTEDEIPGL